MNVTKERIFPVLQRVADRTLDWRFHCWYWGDAIAVDALLEADVEAGGYRRPVVEVLQRWHHSCLPNFDDALAPGGAILRLVMDGELPAAAAERILGLLHGLPRALGAVPALEPHRQFFRFGVCIDAVYHLPATYALAALWRDDAGLAREAVRVALDAMEVLACPAGWAQWYDPAHRRNNQVAWSRGLGWAVLGLLDLMTLLQERAGDEVAEISARVLERLAATQGPDGNWPAVLDHPPAAAETSTAAFYVAAALHPAARGLVALPPRVLERASAALWRAVADDGTFTGVSADVLPNWDIQTYEHCPTEPSPWGQGAALRALCALRRAEGSVKFDGDPGDE